MIVEHNQVVPMIEQIDQFMGALLNHDRDLGTPMIEVIEEAIIKQNSIMIGSCVSLSEAMISTIGRELNLRPRGIRFPPPR